MSDSNTVAQMIDELTHARKSNWQQAGYKQRIFEVFLASPRNECGVPAMSSDTLTRAVRDTLGKDSPEFREIEELLYEVARAWDEWRYALNQVYKHRCMEPGRRDCMGTVVEGVIRDLGNTYVDGTPRLEIHFRMGETGDLPIQIGERVPVRLIVGGAEYAAGLRATLENKQAWLCPDICGADGKATNLGSVLTSVGFSKNDRVRVLVEGSLLTILEG